jgi:hypothetical protein
MTEISDEKMKEINGGSWFDCALTFGGTVASAFAGAYFWTLAGSFATARCIMDELEC